MSSKAVPGKKPGVAQVSMKFEAGVIPADRKQGGGPA